MLNIPTKMLMIANNSIAVRMLSLLASPMRRVIPTADDMRPSDSVWVSGLLVAAFPSVDP